MAAGLRKVMSDSVSVLCAGQTVSSFVRAAGPALAGFIWGLALHIPHGAFFAFGLVSIGAFISQFVYLFVDLKIEI